MRPDIRPLVALSIAVVLVGCSAGKTRHDGPGSTRVPDLPGDAVPRPEPKSRYGNGPNYEVFNKSYTVMRSGTGYQERGVASWYGKKFHGRLTSNREVYDMYAMTAAHKTLPLPTYVRVRNLRNNKAIVVRVNDRGPFAHNRIIDLSYAAALKLDMVRDGTTLVEVTAFNFDNTSTDHPGSARKPQQAPPAQSVAPSPSVSRVFVQVGAYGTRSNAARRLALLSQSGINDGLVYEDDSSTPSLYRVRIGPIADVVQFDVLIEQLEGMGITDSYLITE